MRSPGLDQRSTPRPGRPARAARPRRRTGPREALARGERVADQDQQPRQRAEHPGRARAARAGRASAIASACWRPRVRGRDADDHERAPRAITRDRRPATGRSSVGARARPSDRSSVASTTAEISASSRRNSSGVEVARRVVEQPRAPARRPAVASCASSSARARENADSAASAAEQPGDQDQRRSRPAAARDCVRSSRAHGSLGGHAVGPRLTPCHSASSWSWRPNISRCSSGSAWS